MSANNNWNGYWLRMGDRRGKEGSQGSNIFQKEGKRVCSQARNPRTAPWVFVIIRRLKSVGNRKTKHVHVASRDGNRQKG